MDWVPEYVRDVTVADHHLKGYVSSERELKELIEIHSSGSIAIELQLIEITKKLFHQRCKNELFDLMS